MNEQTIAMWAISHLWADLCNNLCAISSTIFLLTLSYWQQTRDLWYGGRWGRTVSFKKCHGSSSEWASTQLLFRACGYEYVHTSHIVVVGDTFQRTSVRCFYLTCHPNTIHSCNTSMSDICTASPVTHEACESWRVKQDFLWPALINGQHCIGVFLRVVF